MRFRQMQGGHIMGRAATKARKINPVSEELTRKAMAYKRGLENGQQLFTRIEHIAWAYYDSELAGHGCPFTKGEFGGEAAWYAMCHCTRGYRPEDGGFDEWLPGIFRATALALAVTKGGYSFAGKLLREFGREDNTRSIV